MRWRIFIVGLAACSPFASSSDAQDSGASDASARIVSDASIASDGGAFCAGDAYVLCDDFERAAGSVLGPWYSIANDASSSDAEPALAAPPVALDGQAIRFSVSASPDDTPLHKFLNTMPTPFGASTVLSAETQALVHGPLRHVNFMTMVLGTSNGSKVVTYVSFVVNTNGVSIIVSRASEASTAIPGGAFPSEHWGKLSLSIRLPSNRSDAPILTASVNDVAITPSGGAPLAPIAYDFFQLSVGPDYADEGDVAETWSDNVKITLGR